MSGGVDSSVAAWLMRESGFDCEGATMVLYPEADGSHIRDACDAARRIGIPFHVCDFSETFDELVISRFTSEYIRGATPNPCIDCNRHIKFGCFLEHALSSGFDMIATGHYAQISRVNDRYQLCKGADPQKDQSYMLYTLTQEKLSRIALPLGGITKSDVREIAAAQCFASAGSKESQDICFIPDGDYYRFIESRLSESGLRDSGPGVNLCEATLPGPGRFIDAGGRDLGMHKGIHHYTIGQRRGLGISSPHSLYVCDIDPVKNTVTLGSNDNLYTKELFVRDINLIAAEKFDSPIRLSVKIRYRQSEQPATVWQQEAGVLRIEFDRPQRAVTKGQAAVLYDGNTVVGGGTIY